MRWAVADAARAMRGHWSGDSGAGDSGAPECAGAAIDSRAVRGGELFFAMAGENTDGHRFVGAALAAGAAAAVVSDELPADLTVGENALIHVADTTEALHDLTRAGRAKAPEKLVAITGSAGKTTTKELLTAMLGRSYRTACNPGNFNNLLGFPLALLAIPDDTEWMVAEMGMSLPGELSQISRLGRPDVALFTNVLPVHLENFDDLDGIARAKAELLDGLAPGGVVVANAADPRVTAIARGWQQRESAAGEPARVVWYQGRSPAGPEPRPTPRLRVESIAREDGGSRFELVTDDGERAAVELHLLGKHNIENCVAAAACALELGVPLAEIATAASAAEPAAGRGEMHELPGGIRLVDDSYNSNPEAVSYALDALAALPAARRWVVLGDMLELGPEAPRFHREAGERAARLGLSPVLAVGELARDIAAGAEAAGAEAVWLADAGAAAAHAAAELAAGDAVLVKGSRGVGLEAVVTSLTERAATEGGSG